MIQRYYVIHAYLPVSHNFPHHVVVSIVFGVPLERLMAKDEEKKCSVPSLIKEAIDALREKGEGGQILCKLTSITNVSLMCACTTPNTRSYL